MNNIENKIKEEFKNREINPSVNSWDKLNSKLNSTQEKEENKKLFYFKIAAVLIGLLVAFSFFLNGNTNKTIINDNELVKTKNQDNKSKNNKEEELIINDDELVKTISQDNKNIINKEDKSIIKSHEEEKIIVKTIEKKSSLNRKSNSVKNSSKSEIQINKEALASNKTKRQPIKQMPFAEETDNNKSTLLAQNKNALSKKNEVIKNKVTTKKRIFMNSSDDDIDNMLALALGESKTKKNELIINSNELMLVVQNELDKNKRNKILNMIKTGVDTVESIIVSNNN